MPSAVLVALVAVVQGPLQAPAQRELLDLGHLRHVHWLESKGDQERFATAALTAPRDGDRRRAQWRATGSVVEVRSIRGDVEHRLEIPFLLLHPFTWTTRPTWRVLELPGATWVACVDITRSELHVYSFDGGGEVVPVRAATALYDARLRDGSVELLVASGAQLELLALRTGEENTLVATQLSTGLDSIGAASFARSRPALIAEDAPPGDVWAVGWDEGVAALVRAAVGETVQSPTRILLDTPISADAELRLAAARAEGVTWLAVGDPTYHSDVGRVVVARAVGDDVHVERSGRIDPERGAVDQCDWGQAIAFVPDVDSDGVPDLVVSGPWAMWPSWYVELVSTSKWERLAKFTQPTTCMYPVGHWIDVSDDGTSLLVGGTAWRDMPEFLTNDGVLHVLDARFLSPKTSFRLAPVERER